MKNLINLFLLFAFALLLLGCQKDDLTATIDIESKLMADGKNWTKNLDIVPEGYEDQVWWYDDDEMTYAEYGRLYTWDAAIAACQQLGDGWRLPTKDDWGNLAAQYGTWDDSTNDDAYEKLILGGDSDFDALLGGDRDPGGPFEGLGVGGLYWSGTEEGARSAWDYYFFSSNGKLGRHFVDKAYGFSCRCVQDN